MGYHSGSREKKLDLFKKYLRNRADMHRLMGLAMGPEDSEKSNQVSDLRNRTEKDAI